MPSRRLAVLLGVVVLVGLAGCVALSPSSDDPDPEALFESTFVYSDDLEDVTGEQTIEITGGSETISETLRIYERPYVYDREEVLETTDPEREGHVFVSDPSGAWWYYPERSLVERHEASEPFDDDAVRSDRAEMAEWKRDWYDLEYQGTEEVAGREAHVLGVDLRSEAVKQGVSVLLGDTEYVYALETVEAPDEIDVVEQTIWIDAEYDYPLQERQVFEFGDGERYEMVERFETVSFNGDLDDELFEFEPPENVTVESR
ncbi:LolA family protein [Halopiger goleimassiliensis]|uniref:LolA family protein n=1 Tax=Halopiger goleimassiliensis TaxID=1293048 RepID=UPI000677FB9B|nr:outer membrane lipoprotein carrier protein LolA [Halopiger goleimassiliensis]